MTLQETSPCPKCFRLLPLTDFPPTRGKGIYFKIRMCKDCKKKSKQEIWKRYEEKHNKERRQRWHKDPVYRQQIKRACKRYRKRNRANLIVKGRERKRLQRQALINLYGGKCDCCNENRWEFLAIDHINGGGNKERRRLGANGYNKKLRESKTRLPGYRVLCHNCNMSLGFYGYCPHVK